MSRQLSLYYGRPLSWDYGMPMCMDDLVHQRSSNPKMKPFCDAYALLAFNDANLEIPSECYGLLRPFPAFLLENIEKLDSLNHLLLDYENLFEMEDGTYNYLVNV